MEWVKRHVAVADEEEFRQSMKLLMDVFMLDEAAEQNQRPFIKENKLNREFKASAMDKVHRKLQANLNEILDLLFLPHLALAYDVNEDLDEGKVAMKFEGHQLHLTDETAVSIGTWRELKQILMHKDYELTKQWVSISSRIISFCSSRVCN